MSKEITRLRRVLLPKDLTSQSFQPSDRVSVRALSFRLLAHAEFENYLEDQARGIALAAQQSWVGGRKVSVITLNMLAFSIVALKGPPASLQAPPNKSQTQWEKGLSCDESLKKAFSLYRNYLDNRNHGVKEENLLAILLPIGLRYTDLDPLFIAEMNDFASKRGNVAHTSVSGHVQVGINPADEALQVNRIREGLKQLDTELEALLTLA